MSLNSLPGFLGEKESRFIGFTLPDDPKYRKKMCHFWSIPTTSYSPVLRRLKVLHVLLFIFTFKKDFSSLN